MTRINPLWVTVKIARAGQTHEVRVSLDVQEVARAQSGSALDQDALCIQVRSALRKKIPAKSRPHLAKGWPGFVEWGEIRLPIAQALKKLLDEADANAKEQMLKEEHDRTFLEVSEETFDH